MSDHQICQATQHPQTCPLTPAQRRYQPDPLLEAYIDQLMLIYAMQVVGSEEDIFKRSTKEALSWATPRRPFEVCGCLFLFSCPFGTCFQAGHWAKMKGLHAWPRSASGCIKAQPLQTPQATACTAGPVVRVSGVGLWVGEEHEGV